MTRTRRWTAVAVVVGALYGCATPPPDSAPGDIGAEAAAVDAATSPATTPRPDPGETTPTAPAGVGAWDHLPDDDLVALGALHLSTTTTTAPPPPPPPAPVPAPRAAAPAVPSGSVWDRLAECESGGDWSINTGNGHFGGLQFTLQSWRGVGGTGYPHEHGRDAQIHRAERLLALQGWGAWPGCARQLGLR